MALLLRFITAVVVVAAVALAVLSGGLRLAIYNIDVFKSEIEDLLRQQLAPSIAFSGLSGDMIGLNPVIGIEEISLQLPDQSRPLLAERVTFEIDFWTSLFERQPVVREIAGDLQNLELTRDQDGQWSIYTVDLGGSGEYQAPGFTRLLLLLPRYLKLRLERLLVQDLRDGKQYQLVAVDAHMNRRGDTTQIQFSAVLPEELGSTVTLKTVVDARATRVYVDSPRLELAPVARLLDLDTRGLRQGTLAGEIWIDLLEYRLLAVSGKLALADGILQTSPRRKPLRLDQRARFSGERSASGWRFNSLFERLDIDGRELPAFRAQIEIGSRGGQPTLAAWIDRLQVSGLPALAGQWLPERLARQIEEGELAGNLADLYLSLNIARPEEFLFAGNARGLSSGRVGQLPGVENLDADIFGSNRRVGAHLRGAGLALDFGDEFLEPLRFARAEAEAALEFAPGRALVAVDGFEVSNADARARGRLWLETDAGMPPFMYLRAEFGEGNAAATRKYLPRNVTPPRTVAWLDRAIVGGKVPGGALQFHGRLRDVRELVEDSAGELQVGFEVTDAEVDFAPGWAPVTGGAGRVLFHNTSMTIDLERGWYQGIAAHRVGAVIADFADPVLELDIAADTRVDAALAAWTQMPVGRRFADLVGRVDGADGEVAARVAISLPLKDAREADVNVTLDLQSASLRVDDWGLDLARLRGRLQVTDDGVFAERLDGRFHGEPVTLEIGAERGGTRILASGLLESRQMLAKLPAALRDRVNGLSQWQLRLSLPRAGADEARPDWRLVLASNLGGTEFEFPAPLHKTAGAERRLSAELAGYAGRIDFGAQLGDELSARGRLRAAADGYRLADLELALNEALLQRPQPGVVLHGSAPEFDLGGWAALFAAADAGPKGALSRVDLRFDLVRFGNRRLDQVLLEVSADDDAFAGSIDSRQARGSFLLPRQASVNRPRQIELEHLLIEKLEQAADYSTLRPASFGDLEIRCKNLTYHGMQFTDLDLATRATGDVLEVDRFTLRRDEVQLTGSAQWRYDPVGDSHLSSANLRVRGPGFGEAIAGLGFGDSIRGGRIDFGGGFTWPGPLVDPNLETLDGDAQLRLEDGVLNNVEPGSGRFVGLLSLSALPRRLSLDFSDILIDGMNFDTITGSYRLQHGVLTTDDTRLDGPAARIKITGRTGVVTRSYDQHIRVTPKIRQTLPVIGALSAGSTVGWGLLLLQNLFKKSIDKAVEVEYEVTGSWDDPKITLIRAVDENQQELPSIER